MAAMRWVCHGLRFGLCVKFARQSLNKRGGAHDCLAARKGFEPLTSGLGNRCSILLSYRAARRFA